MDARNEGIVKKTFRAETAGKAGKKQAREQGSLLQQQILAEDGYQLVGGPGGGYFTVFDIFLNAG